MEKIVLRVYFADGSHRSLFAWPDTTTIENLWAQICDKLGMPEQEWESFFLWAVTSDMELLLCAETTVRELLDTWPEMHKQYRPFEGEGLKRLAHAVRGRERSMPIIDMKNATSVQQVDKPEPVTLVARGRSFSLGKITIKNPLESAVHFDDFRLVFKPTAVLPRDIELRCRSETAVRLLYWDAVYNVINSNYPAPPEMAVLLAAMQMQINCGDHQESTHVKGFLLKELDQYVPAHLFKSKKPDEWETAILWKHKDYSELSNLQVMMTYLAEVRKLDCYGSSFFRVQYCPQDLYFFKQPFQGTVMLGINERGIHVFDLKDASKKTILIFPYENIEWWEADKGSFWFQLGDKDLQYDFRTTQGQLIADLIKEWLVELRDVEKRKKLGDVPVVVKTRCKEKKGKKDKSKRKNTPEHATDVIPSGVPSSSDKEGELKMVKEKEEPVVESRKFQMTEVKTEKKSKKPKEVKGEKVTEPVRKTTLERTVEDLVFGDNSSRSESSDDE